MMKPIAILLPQFHEMDINNIWWGKGFTDWDKVKGATPLFAGHIQPKKPIDEHYYNMLDKETMIMQTKQMNDAGIYGMAYYHYWYDHKPVMEKPAEQLLFWKDIPQRFMMYWSNCNWYHSKPTSYQRKMIFNQEYGFEEDWKKHINYLIQFFCDDRYIKYDEKPVLCIYRPGEIPHFDEMIQCFEHECVAAGLKGIYIIETLFNYDERSYSDYSNAVMYREPNCCKKYAASVLKEGNSKNPEFVCDDIPKIIKTYKYKDAYECSIDNQSKYMDKKKLFLGAFTGWDNTPRHGYKGFLFEENYPHYFGDYLRRLGNLCAEDDFVFINAWNEWAEGMYLEPDEKNGYGFLNAIKKVCKDKEVLL